MNEAEKKPTNVHFCLCVCPELLVYCYTVRSQNPVHVIHFLSGHVM